MTTIDAAQTADVIETARGTGMLIPILLGVTRGLRRGEVVALRWRSVDLDAGQLAAAEQTNHGTREKEPKSGKGRAVASRENRRSNVIPTFECWPARNAESRSRKHQCYAAGGNRPKGEVIG